MLPAEPSYHCHSHITDKKTEIRSSEEAVEWVEGSGGTGLESQLVRS